jgi:hypothetical protein
MGLFDDLLEEEGLLQRPTTRQPRKRRSGLFDDLLEEEGLLEATPTPTPKPLAQPRRLPWEKEEKEGFWRQAADIPVGLGKGAAQGVRMFTDILGADNPVSQSIRGVEDYLGNLMSAQAKNDQAEIARIMEEAQDKGVLDQVMAAVKAFSVAPVDLTVQALGTMAPIIVGGLAANTAKLAVTGIRGGAAAAKGLTTGQMVAAQAGVSTAMGAGNIKGQIYDAVRQELIDQGVSEDIANQQAVKAQEYDGKNLDQILIGAGLGALAGSTGAEKIIGGILTRSGVGATKSRIVNSLKTGITEAVPESAQGMQEQVAVNQALIREGMDVPLTRGVFSSGALEGLAGFGVGAPIGAIQKTSVAEDAARKAEEADAPATAEALRKSAQEAAREEKDISKGKQTIEDIEKATQPSVPIGEEFVMPPKEEFKASYATLSPEALAETEVGFQEQLQDEDADTRAFAQTALEALAEFKAEQTPVPPTPVRKAELPTDALPIETPAATYGREEGVYDVFADVRRQPLPPSGPAFESAQVIEQELARAETLRQSPEGRAQLRRELQGEQMTGEVRRAVEQALATTPEVAEEGDVFAVSPVSPTAAEPTPTAVEPTPVTPVEAETAASLSRVADNTATDEEVVRLARQGLVNIQDGQNVITPRGEEVMQMAGAPLPALTPEERTAEIAATPAIVEQAPPVAEAPAVTPAPVAEVPVATLEPKEQTVDLGDNIKADFIGQGDVIIKDKDGERVGRFESSSMENGLQAINVTFLEEDYRGKGIGQKVVKKLRDIYGAIASDVTSDMSKSAKSMWINAGAKIEQITEGEDIQSRYVLRKEQPAVAVAPAPTPVTTPPVTEAVTPAPELAAAKPTVEIVPTSEGGKLFVDWVNGKIAEGAKLYQGTPNERALTTQDIVELIQYTRKELPASSENDLKYGGLGGLRSQLNIMRSADPSLGGTENASKSDQIAASLNRAEGIDVATIEPSATTPTPVAPAAEPAGIAVGSKINVKGDKFNKYVVEEVLPQTDFEARNNERSYILKNERTGEVMPRPFTEQDFDKVGGKKLLKMAAAPATSQLWATPPQEISSADTSINQRQMPATFKRVKWQSGTRNADIGGGRFDNATEYLAESGVENVVYDPYNRTQESNQAAVAKVSGGQSDTATVNNVLNVIAEPESRDLVIRQAADAIKPDGKAYFLIYEGDKKGTGSPTKAGWQENRKAETYVAEIRKHFGSVTRKGNLIIAEQPAKPSSILRQATEIRVEEDAQVVPEADRYTFEEAGIRAIEFFGGVAPEGLLIVNDSVDPDYRMKAGYDPETGQIILNRAFIRRGDSIEDIITHELGHYIFSDPQFQSDFQNFLESMPEKTRADIEAIINASYNEETMQSQIEERQVIAFTTLVKASKQSLSAWENLKNTIKRWINRVLGTNIKLSDEGAMAVFNVGYKRFKRGDQIVRAMQEGVLRMAAEPTAKPTRRTKMQSIIDISTGVKRPRTKLTVDEMAALKDQIRMGARKRRADKQTQKEFAKDVTEYLRGMAIRGKVSAPQLRAITSKAMQTQFDNEASILGFINYANKVIENANYNRDISDAKAAIKTAKGLASKKSGPPNIKRYLAELAEKDPRMIEPEDMSPRQIEVDGEMITEAPISVAEYTAVLKEYGKALGPVTAEGYAVVPDAEIVDFINKLNAQIGENQLKTDSAGFTGDIADLAEKTPEQINEELARDEERKSRLEEKVNKLAESAQIALVNYENSEMTSEEKGILDDLKRIDLAAIDIGNRKEFIRVANNILVNNKFYGSEKLSQTAKGQYMAAEAAKDSEQVKRNKATLDFFTTLLGDKSVKLLNLGGQSFSDVFRNIAGTKEAPRLLYQMGFGLMERGRANANRANREITDGIRSKYRAIEQKYGQKISDKQGMFSMGVAATLIQTSNDETEVEGLQRMRTLIQRDIEAKKESPDKDRRKSAAYTEKALQEVDSDTVEGVIANLKRLHPANHDAMMFLMNEVLPSYKPLLKEHDELFNNQTDNYSNPYYLPISYRTDIAAAKGPEDLQRSSRENVAAPKQSPNSIKRIKNTVLPSGKVFDYNLTRNVMDSLSNGITAAYTNPGLQQVTAFLRSPDAKKALGGTENLDFVIRRVNGLAASRNRRAYEMDAADRIADMFANFVRKVGVSVALGGVGQALKQAPDQIATTVANVGIKISSQAWADVSQARDLMRQFAIGERGEIAGGAKWINQLEGNYTKVQQYIESGNWPKVMEAFENINNVWLIALKKSDTAAATHGWVSYYRKYLQDNNIPFTNWDNETKLAQSGERGRVEAGLYADQMVDIYQGSSDPTRMATFAQRGTSGGGNLLKTIVLPFSSFVIQQRSRILSDVRDASFGDTDEKKVAARGLVGTMGGIFIFHLIRRYTLPFITGGVASGVYALLGAEMDEPDEEEKAQKADRVKRQFLGEVAANMLVGGFSAYAERGLIDGVNFASYLYDKQTENESVYDDKGEVVSWDKYRRKLAPLYRYTGPGADSSMGMIDIMPGQFQETIARLADIGDEEIMDNLTEEEQRVLILAALSETLYTLRLNDADVARMFKRMAREVKEQANAREKAERDMRRLFGVR